WAAAAPGVALVLVEDLVAGEVERTVGGDDGHHLTRVRRLTVDEPVVVADGAGRWYPARVAMVAKGSLRTERTGPDRVEPTLAPHLTIAFAPAKRDRGVEVVHQLVELGVDRIVPLSTRRGVVRWGPEDAAVAKLRRVAREAAMQARRARLAEIGAPVTLTDLADRPGLVVAERAHVTGGPVLAPAELLAAPEVACVVVVGPEGGFSSEERAVLAHAPRIAVGPHVLRSVTAPTAVAAALAPYRCRWQ
ncbi:MAG: RsmE family RNA methyltransferase, partial [Acidimicrobiia bacterium]